MTPEKRITPAGNGGDSETIGGGFTLDSSATRPQSTAARLKEVEDLLEAAWAGLASGTLDLHRLRQHSEWLHAIYWIGYDQGIAAQSARVAQAEWNASRLYAKAYPSDNATAVEARFQRAIASCPPHIDPHSPEWFEHALRGVVTGGTA